MIADLDILKEIMVKEFDKFSDHSVSSQKHYAGIIYLSLSMAYSLHDRSLHRFSA